MSRRKQSNPRPLLDFSRKKSPDASTQDQSSVHTGKIELQKTNGYVVTKGEDEEHTQLIMNMKNVNNLLENPLPNHFVMAPSKPSTSADHNSCSPLRNTLSKEQLKIENNTATSLTTMKGKKSKIPAKRKSNGKIMPIDKNGNHIYECPQCKESLRSLRELTTHLRSHNGINNSRSDHECHQCHKILSSSSSLDRHMLTHSGEKPFSCNICTQSFTTNGNMHRHMRTHEKKNETKRTYLKPKQKGLSSRVGAYGGKNANNILTSEKLNELNAEVQPWMELQHVDKKVKPNSLSPPNNSIVSSTQPTQDAPQDLSQKKSNPSLRLLENVHREEFGDPYENSSLDINVSTHSFPLTCIVQQKSPQNKYSCSQCSNTFPCQTELDLHYQSHFTDEPTSCSTCNITFNSTDEFKQHNLYYHQDRGKECQRAFMKSLNLTSCSGTRSVSPQSEIGANEIAPVNKRSNSEGQLPGLESPKISLEDVNSQKDFGDSSLLSENNTSQSKDGLSSNAQGKATNLSTKKKSCTYCNQIFPNTRAAKSHERSHLGLSPYQCKSCNYSSPDKSTLIRHMRTHNGERPYQCTMCKYPFTTKANCERHVKKKHHINRKEELEMKVTYNKESSKEVPNGEDAFSSPDTVQDPILSNFGKNSPRSSSISPVPSCINNNQSYLTSDTDVKPLDLRSSKNFPSSVSSPSGNSSILDDDGIDEPIDLSVKKSKKSSRKASKATESSTHRSKCSLDFQRNIHPQWHMNQLHNNMALPSIPQQEKLLRESPQEYVFQECNRISPSVSFDSDNGDLASVKQIIHTAGANTFKEYMNPSEEDIVPSHVNGHEDISNPVEYDTDLVKKIKEEPQDPEENDGINMNLILEENNSNSLIDNKERISQESDESKQKPLKKKRNSYADSPHKLSCPYCTRNFPWASSLKRHILTHTGEKPFECPKCHVIFSTKSNRERHLIRKHGVNMLDPAARQSMDRPHKCHLCVFSSFATKENLRRHYRERHPGISIPENVGYDPDEKLLNLSSPSTDLLNDNNNNNIDNDNSNNNNNKNINNDNNGDDDDDDDEDVDESRVNSYNEVLHSTSKNNGMKEFDINVSSIKHEIDQKEGPDVVKLVKDENGDEMLPNNNYWSITADMSITEIDESADICIKCNKVFSSHHLLLKHLKDHAVDLPFKCYLCDISFDERAECLAHIEQKHNTQWRILVTKNNIDNIEHFCNKTDHIVSQRCKMSADIDDSRKTDYSSRKVYCSFCAQRFWSLQDLRRHMRSHTVNNLIEESPPISKSDTEVNRTKDELPEEMSFEEPQDGCKSSILPEILGLKESDIEKMLENAISSDK